MIEALGEKLYSTTEVSLLLGIGTDTLGRYVKRAGLQKRTIKRVRYYTEDDIRKILLIPGQRLSKVEEGRV
jgi:DNA-binding transcriptional MerR regulator